MTDETLNTAFANMSLVSSQLIEQTEKVQRWVGVWLSDDDEFGHPEYELVERHKRTLELYQELTDRIRLSTKYMQFDLEVTKRENAQLLKLLNELFDKYETSDDLQGD